ncbi:hypothetical protein PENANT_c003G00546 [Penicillium antarcticum]|uniref:Uncharacterized protein n=1 Tax=Penicillium antarcticum TaxID=416450 RepID=A0A1V6QII3_9EURO|nr:hypothetical protein PENANT_c003G00546 [Penicillium antarcticum]
MLGSGALENGPLANDAPPNWSKPSSVSPVVNVQFAAFAPRAPALPPPEKTRGFIDLYFQTLNQFFPFMNRDTVETIYHRDLLHSQWVSRWLSLLDSIKQLSHIFGQIKLVPPTMKNQGIVHGGAYTPSKRYLLLRADDHP